MQSKAAIQKPADQARGHYESRPAWSRLARRHAEDLITGPRFGLGPEIKSTAFIRFECAVTQRRGETARGSPPTVGPVPGVIAVG
jgi:hypothetical protein